MIMTQEHGILKASAQFERMADFVRQASSEGRGIDQIETDLWGQMLELGRQMLGGFVAGHQQGDLGPTLEHQGRRLQWLHEKSNVLQYHETKNTRVQINNSFKFRGFAGDGRDFFRKTGVLQPD